MLTFKLRYYLGPKDYTDLAKVPGLKQLINYGTFSNDRLSHFGPP